MGVFDPIEMPYPLPVRSKVFDLSHNQDVSPVGSGFIQTIERSRPVWVANYDTPPLREDRLNTFQAFIDQLSGARTPFLAFDPRRPKPFAYRTAALGSEPWTAGTVTVASVDIPNSELDLAGFVSGAILTRSDYIAFQQGNAWYLFRTTEDKVASGGGTLSVKVTPRPIAITGTPNARLTRACAAMKMLGRPKTKDTVEDGGTSFTLQAVQFVDRSA